ncbi:hypothetical protein HNP50_000466 [Elizabethkingia anophelis]|nr:hypothetical protein [Elizabethkingia anophelis]MCW2466093.1 hypothetical protein [Elizabethkingia anophelis]MCW2469778.1 hypothetical protein [Elizabethkingia anophelis]
MNDKNNSIELSFFQSLKNDGSELAVSKNQIRVL